MPLPSNSKKVVMAGSGLTLLAFLLLHLYRNALLVKGMAAFNQFSLFLRGLGPLLLVIEGVLLAVFVAHVVSSLLVRSELRAATPPAPLPPNAEASDTVFSRTMMATGLIILVFVPVHVFKFRFGAAPEMGGLWSRVMDEFADPIAVAWYLIAAVALGMHLAHGIGGGLRSLGLSARLPRRPLEIAGFVLAWAIALGFAALPLWAFVRNQSF